MAKRIGGSIAILAALGLLLGCRHLKPEKNAPQNPAVKNIPGRPDIRAYAGFMLVRLITLGLRERRHCSGHNQR